MKSFIYIIFVVIAGCSEACIYDGNANTQFICTMHVYKQRKRRQGTIVSRIVKSTLWPHGLRTMFSSWHSVSARLLCPHTSYASINNKTHPIHIVQRASLHLTFNFEFNIHVIFQYIYYIRLFFTCTISSSFHCCWMRNCVYFRSVREGENEENEKNATLCIVCVRIVERKVWAHLKLTRGHFHPLLCCVYAVWSFKFEWMVLTWCKAAAIVQSDACQPLPVLSKRHDTFNMRKKGKETTLYILGNWCINRL